MLPMIATTSFIATSSQTIQRNATKHSTERRLTCVHSWSAVPPGLSLPTRSVTHAPTRRAASNQRNEVPPLHLGTSSEVEEKQARYHFSILAWNAASQRPPGRPRSPHKETQVDP